MADAVGTALEEGATLVVEAGTGVGKTFAYLVPAMLHPGKVMIATATRHLQDQLFLNDLPRVKTILGASRDVALLKGRSNYLCRYRLSGAKTLEFIRSGELREQLRSIDQWVLRSKSGDLSECESVPEGSPIWGMVTSTTDNCLGSECPDFQGCFVFEARRRAQEADLVVINHHLFCADAALRDEGFGEFLPDADALIFDEAHQLPEIASAFAGETLTSRQLIDLARDTVNEQMRDAPDMAALRDLATALEKAIADFRLAFEMRAQKDAWSAVRGHAPLVDALHVLEAALAELNAGLKLAAPRGKGLENAQKRAEAALALFARFSQAENAEEVLWYELNGRGFALHATPVDASAGLARALHGRPRALIFTSATLTAQQRFEFFTRRVGLAGDTPTLRLDSPFDYPNKALLYHPTGMPEPNSAHFTAAVVEAALPVLEASQGRAFMLFTSHRALKEAEGLLRNRITHPLLVQGDMPRHYLIERFRELGNAVLLGTQSFWEGVDVQGEALSLVIIDKLPFATPGDPVLKARMDAMRKQGLEPFVHYQLPQAILTLKQGAGRLIRGEQDRGVLMLCDPRIRSKGYGKQFVESLPPMRRTQSLQQVCAFFKS
ncbi:MAG: helicase [Gammaproteobacteria bacterium 28-57-27]|nr:MAG: helicase [Gammaproteobacteria bacterium 28-57-27]